jgi:hypothetical protein
VLLPFSFSSISPFSKFKIHGQHFDNGACEFSLGGKTRNKESWTKASKIPAPFGI